jgi:hypothetical protein
MIVVLQNRDVMDVRKKVLPLVVLNQNAIRVFIYHVHKNQSVISKVVLYFGVAYMKPIIIKKVVNAIIIYAAC